MAINKTKKTFYNGITGNSREKGEIAFERIIEHICLIHTKYKICTI